MRDPECKIVSDFDYWLRIGMVGPMMRVPYTLACWRKRGEQSSGAKSDARAADHVNVMHKFFAPLQVSPEIQAIKNEAVCWAHLVAGSISGSKLTALRHFLWALLWYPWILTGFKTYHIIYTRLIHAWRKG